MNPEDRKLFEACTYAATGRLEELRQQMPAELDFSGPEEVSDQLEKLGCLTDEEVLELWFIFRMGAVEYAGYRATMIEFGQWLCASGPFEGNKPAEVTW